MGEGYMSVKIRCSEMTSNKNEEDEEVVFWACSKKLPRWVQTVSDYAGDMKVEVRTQEATDQAFLKSNSDDFNLQVLY